MVLEKTLESPLDYKEIQPVHPKGNQSWVFKANSGEGWGGVRKGALYGPLGPLRSAQDRLPSHPSAGPTGPLGKKAGAEFSGRPSPPAPRTFQQPLARPLPREVTGRSGVLA